jgi:anti-anti-sigma factor
MQSIGAKMSLGAPLPHYEQLPASFRAVVHVGGPLALVGELDISGLDALRVALDQALLEAHETIEIDATELSFIDSAAISELLRYQLVAATKHRCFVVRASRQVAAVLGLLDLDPILVSPDKP